MVNDRNIERERTILKYHGFAVHYVALFAITIGYYYVADMFSRFVLSGLSLYIYGVLAGLTGGLWSFGVQESYKTWRDIKTKDPFYSPDEFYNLLETFDNIIVKFGAVLVIEIALIFVTYIFFIW